MHISEVWENGRIPRVREDAQSLLWNNTIAPILRKLESVAAGIVNKDTVEMYKT